MSWELVRIALELAAAGAEAHRIANLDVERRGGRAYCRRCGRQVSLKRSECRSCGASLMGSPAASSPIARVSGMSHADRGRRRRERVAERERRQSEWFGNLARRAWDGLGEVGQPVAIGMVIAIPVVIGLVVLMASR